MSEIWTPKPYQLRGVKAMTQQASLGLFLDPGMGKTSTWLAAFTLLKELGYVDKMLIIVPLMPMYDTWPREIEKFQDFEHLTWCFLHGPDKDWKLKNIDADIYLINPEGINWLTDRCDPSTLADVLLVDESTKFKNSQSKRFKCMRPFWHKFLYRWIGTGTPSPNGLEDLFSQIYILDGGAALGKYITHFRKRWFYTEGWNPYQWIPHEHAFDEITTVIAPLVLQLSAEDYLDMPELMQVEKLFDLPPAARKAYDALDQDFIIDEDNTPGWDGEEIVAPSEAAVSGKLRQICNGAVYTNHPNYEKIHDVKLDLLDELLDEIGQQPTLIVYEFKHDKQRIALRHLDWPDITGMSGGCLKNLIARFNAGEIPRMLIQSGKAHGLNIQGASNHMIMFGPSWDWENVKQMIDRLYRQGQRSSMVMVYWLLARDTMDQVVLSRLRQKAEEEYNVKKAISDKRGEL